MIPTSTSRPRVPAPPHNVSRIQQSFLWTYGNLLIVSCNVADSRLRKAPQKMSPNGNIATWEGERRHARRQQAA